MHRRFFLAAATFALAAPALAQGDEALQLDIEPSNDLERAFVDAYDHEAARPEFRRLLLESPVWLALANSGEDAPPRELSAEGRDPAGLIFTSDARMSIVLGPAAPRVQLTGREALARLRGKHAIINLQLVPMLILEPDDIETYLAPAQPSVGPTE